MQNRILAGTALIVAAASLAACTTRPVVVNTPGPGATTIQVPVPATPDISLTNAVQASLKSTLGTDAAGVTARVEDGTVYLTGHVATAALRDQAIRAAQGTAGVKAVVATGLVVS
jgi:hypothetical protein